MADGENSTAGNDEEPYPHHTLSGDGQTDGVAATDNENLGLSNHKGKGKDASSMVDRFQSSGRTLFNSAMASQELPNISSNAKGGGESSTSAQITTHQSIFGIEQQRNGHSSNPANRSFKSDRSSHGMTDAFETFAAGESPKADMNAANTLDTQSTGRSITQQEALDGSDVVELLLQPDIANSFPVDESEELTPLEAARLQDALFGSGSAWPFWDRLLNFNPDFVTGLEESGRSVEIMGTTDAGLARSTWLKQWNDVLTSYTDEVWGDLEPLAMQAKEELEKATYTDELPDSSTAALDRLRLILKHLRGC
ncbi:hypothetical protein VFPPC_05476 [Pochonia chlamydosporia 170]|uniref:Uncharacterized protein n=1 Tax=Pochonia chlamydosporia 170 TaxID=1380566 RepID=A0A179FF62_METCM|nr:hypothetical protein VFPPC_05476 [Pochonia chlamydosporia 170]OAQ64152.1 hypothetical protein VFPPC_05476 [Pochonia chlamydosporia 170]